MNDTVIIAHPSTDSSRSISAQVATVSDKLVILETSATEDMELLCKEYGCALLIIDSSLFHTESRLSGLLQDTAILTLIEAEQVQDYLANIILLSGNCALLISSAIDSLLMHHVQILLKQRTSTQELLIGRDKTNTLSKELPSSKQSLQAQQRYLDILSERDELTGIYNRRHLTTILQQEFSRGKTLRQPRFPLALHPSSTPSLSHPTNSSTWQTVPCTWPKLKARIDSRYTRSKTTRSESDKLKNL